MDDALVDLVHVSAEDRLDAALLVERLGPQLARRDEAALLEVQPTDAEVAELVLVGEVDDLGVGPNTARPELVFDVEGVLERGAFARARAVADTDHEGLLLAGLELGDDLFELACCFLGMAIRADRHRVPVRSESGGRGEVELGPRRVDEVVVLDLLDLPGLARRRVLHRDESAAARLIPLWVDGYGLGLTEIDTLLRVDGSQREGDLIRRHPPHADPDVGRDPVPLGVRRHDDDLMRAVELPAQMQSRGVAGDSGTKDDDASHIRS